MHSPLTRRRLLRTAGAAGLAAVAGCADVLGTSARRSVTREAAEATPALDAAGFGAYVDRARDRYGRHGVWGTASDGSTGGLSFAGAWTGCVRLQGGDAPGTTDGTPPIARVDWALALYRLPGRAGDGPVRHRCWLWAGAIPRPVEGRLGKTSLTALSVGVSLTVGSMGPYAPASSVTPDRSPATVAPTGPGPAGPRGTLVVRAGRAQPDPDTTRVGAGGGFGVTWAGGSSGPVSVAGVCDVERPRDARHSFRVPVAVAGGRGRF